MKATIFKNIFALFSAIYFLMVGTGYNVIQYCCDSCREEGIERVAEGSCSDVHTHKSAFSLNDHHTQSDFACNDIQHLTSECHLLRLQIDTPAVNDELESENHISIIDKLTFYSAIIAPSSPDFQYPTSLLPKVTTQGYFITGRAIIALHSVLLI